MVNIRPWSRLLEQVVSSDQTSLRPWSRLSKQDDSSDQVSDGFLSRLLGRDDSSDQESLKPWSRLFGQDDSSDQVSQNTTTDHTFLYDQIFNNQDSSATPDLDEFFNFNFDPALLSGTGSGNSGYSGSWDYNSLSNMVTQQTQEMLGIGGSGFNIPDLQNFGQMPDSMLSFSGDFPSMNFDQASQPGVWDGWKMAEQGIQDTINRILFGYDINNLPVQKPTSSKNKFGYDINNLPALKDTSSKKKNGIFSSNDR